MPKKAHDHNVDALKALIAAYGGGNPGDLEKMVRRAANAFAVMAAEVSAREERMRRAAYAPRGTEVLIHWWGH